MNKYTPYTLLPCGQTNHSPFIHWCQRNTPATAVPVEINHAGEPVGGDGVPLYMFCHVRIPTHTILETRHEHRLSSGRSHPSNPPPPAGCWLGVSHKLFLGPRTHPFPSSTSFCKEISEGSIQPANFWVPFGWTPPPEIIKTMMVDTNYWFDTIH